MGRALGPVLPGVFDAQSAPSCSEGFPLGSTPFSVVSVYLYLAHELTVGLRAHDVHGLAAGCTRWLGFDHGPSGISQIEERGGWSVILADARCSKGHSRCFEAQTRSRRCPAPGVGRPRNATMQCPCLQPVSGLAP